MGISYDAAVSLLGIYPKNYENINTNNYMLHHAYYSIIYNSTHWYRLKEKPNVTIYRKMEGAWVDWVLQRKQKDKYEQYRDKGKKWKNINW